MTALADQPRIYTPKGAARTLWGCHDPEILIEGPAGTGKTRAVIEKLHALAVKYPGARILMVRKSRASMTETILVTYERDVLPMGAPMKGNQQRSHRTHYDYPNGSIVVVGGMDNPERVLSGEYDVIAFFQAEEATENDWETLLTRLRSNVMPYQQGIADCNPAHPGHWLNERANRGGMTRLLSRHGDNPSLTTAYMDTLRRLTGTRRARLFLGQWAGSEGIVYDRWDRAVHVKVREGPWARVIVGVDYGYTNPTAAVRVCIDGDGRAHVEAEGYGKGLNESEQVGLVDGVSTGRRDVESFVVDPSAAGLRNAMHQAGMSVTEADNDVVAGINRVQDRLVVAGDGLPRLTVDPRCTNLIREFESYEWLPDKPKDTPKKENDHALDALRYAVMHVDQAGEYSGSVVLAGDDRPTYDPVKAWEARRARDAAWDRGEDLENE